MRTSARDRVVESRGEMSDEQEINPNDIAVVGMAVRVPGARNINEYWKNLKEGVESIRTFSEAELLAQGESPEQLRKKNYVRAAAPLDDMEMFDGEFFGFSPKESAILDPQHRHFYETCWEALENAAHPPERFEGPIGVWAGCGMGSYFYFNLCSNPDLVRSVGMFLLRHTGNDKDFLSTRVSYLLNLTGPSVGVQTACSTSLVAIHYACQSLLAREVDMAVAGGVTIELPHRRGYLFHEGEILSPDGHCHAFDHRAQGTVFGSGAGAVVLRRLEDAIADGDVIHAVIRGTAINNDGSGKVNYLAPSVDGQAKCMAEAYALADVSPDTIEYIECHGTGTYLGDPIEVAALTQAYRKDTKRVGFCRLGSVKSNIGHLDTAAGVASFAKAVLSLRNRQMAPSLSFEKPNPTIDFETSPFLVNDRLRDWPRANHPRRAAVNSLGVGGTNAHIVLEEPPARPQANVSKRAFQLLTLSAKSTPSLEGNSQRLAAHLSAHGDVSLADTAWTLHHGRRHFEKRRVVVASTHDEAARLLASADPRRVFTHTAVARPEVAFVLPGGGAQYARMGADLYAREPIFRQWMDRGMALLKSKHSVDLAPHLFGLQSGASAEEMAKAQAALDPMPYQLPAIFLVEYALAQLWQEWGVTPKVLLGHSLGENTAACLAGVLSFEDALGLVALRGALFARVAGGGMLSVNLPQARVEELLPEGLDLAVINVPDVTVVSGPMAQIDAFLESLTAQDIEAKRLAIPVAAHSRALEPILRDFEAYLRSIKLSPPKIPFYSNRSGELIKDSEATDPVYWVQHLRSTVRFSTNLDRLLANENVVVIEVGPGRTLSSLAKQHPKGGPRLNAIVSLRHRDEDVLDDVYFMTAIGRAWASGVQVDWARMWDGEQRRRVELPTYAFNHQHFFIQPGKAREGVETSSELLKNPDLGDWGRVVAWEPRLAPRMPKQASTEAPKTWLLFADRGGVAGRLRERLLKRGQTVVLVHEGDSFSQRGDFEYSLAPERGREGYVALLRDLVGRGLAPAQVAHFWLASADETFRPGSSLFHQHQERGFYSLLFLAQAIAEEGLPPPVHVTVFANGMQSVQGEPLPYPEKATVLGPLGVIPRELTGGTASAVDIVLPAARNSLFGGRLGMGLVDPFAGKRAVSAELERLVDKIELEVLSAPGNRVAALRDDGRYEPVVERLPLDPNLVSRRIPQSGVVVITGGLGGLGLLFAEHLARTRQAKLALIARTELPHRESWDLHLRTYGHEDRASRQILKVRELEALGSKVLVLSADVTIEMEMDEAIGRVTSELGAIDAVLHTAGVVRDGLLVTKTQADCEEVFTPKIHGTLVLDKALERSPNALVVLFSSTSAQIKARGQVDYVAANAFLDHFALAKNARARAEGRAARYVSLAWGIWNDVGMAHDAMAKRTNPSLWSTLGRATHPLMDARQRSAKGQLATLLRLQCSTHWLLDEHRTKGGLALVPGTGYLELARGALNEFGARGPFEIRDLLFLKALPVRDDETKDVRVVLTPSESGYGFEVRSRVVVDGRSGWELHAQANLVLSGLHSQAPLELSELEGRCRLRRQANAEGLTTAQEAHLQFGARWRVLREVLWGRGEALAELSLDPSFEDEASGLALHPALVDIATGFAMDLIEGYDGSNLWVPVSYERVRVIRPLPAKIRSWVRLDANATEGPDFAAFNVTLTDLDGNVCVEVRRLTIKRLPLDFDLSGAGREAKRSELTYDEELPRELSPAEELLKHNLEQGILAAEGVRAFEAALESGESHVVISSLELDGLITQAGALIEEPSGGDSAKFARPNLDSEYVAPRDDIERTLVALFQELLGVDMVGVRDSFFDLGGHSLIAVRLFASVKKAYRVEFAISLLFEAPTVERIAERVRERLGVSSAEASVTQVALKAPSEPRPRFAHLVAMHGGAPSTEKAPFFLVAGMFGNVLNLRHLAHLVGTDREFYGLQARGLYGDETPHQTFEEMARAYLAEIKIVQPKGPYLLGGFSGGGITAYEMAQELTRAGEKVGLLIFLDTPVPLRAPLTAKDRALIQLEEIKAKGPQYLGQWAEKRMQWEVAKLRKRFEEAEPQSRPDEFDNEKMETAFRQALERYAMNDYAGAVSLFRPKLVPRWVVDGKMVDKDRHYMTPDNGWRSHVGSLDVFEVPGDHDSMVLEPNVRVLAKRLRKLIEQAESLVGEQR